jgi:hypothetical protein
MIKAKVAGYGGREKQGMRVRQLVGGAALEPTWGQTHSWRNRQALQYQNPCKSLTTSEVLERETRLELATSTLARLCPKAPK